MNSPDRDLRTALTAAITVPIAMIAYQVAGKATRDALFLSTFGATRLPAAILTSSLLAILAVVVCGRAMARYGPGRVLPPLFAVSAGFLLFEWLVSTRYMRVSAALVFMHFNILGALLISGFWSMVNERFDPRTAKQQIGRIGAASTLGGLLGGVLAERVGAMVSITAMLPVLAALHLICSRAIVGLRPHRVGTVATAPVPWTLTGGSALKVITQRSYLRSLVVLVILATVSEGLLDYVFKARAAAMASNGEALIRLFAAFYTGVSVITFLFQAGVSRLALEELGLARTVAALPAAVAVGGVGALVAPSLVTTGIARGFEAVLRNSLYRSGYELLFTPISPQDKRQTKSIIDVAFVRLGDAIGAGLVQVALFAGLVAAIPLLLAMAIILSIVAVMVALRLNRGYVAALEKSLLSRAVQLDINDIADSTTRTALFQTAGMLDFSQIGPLEPAPQPVALDPIIQPSQQLPGVNQPAPPRPSQTAVRSSGLQAPIDPDSHRLTELRSANAERVRATLKDERQPPRWMVAHIIPLLAWDAVAEDAAQALRRAGVKAVGQMVDALLDPDEEFVIRRRIPAVLASCPSDRTVQGLLAGLEDSRFEVRYRCGRALARLDLAGEVHGLDADQVYEAVLREVGVDRRIWESQRLLDRADEDDGSPFVDEFLRQRAGRSLEHVFTVLSLVLPAQPLTIAFRGLHTDDRHLRGTALEYLETSLPARVREKLWPFLEDSRPQTGTVRPREAILADLVRSNESIALNLEALRRKHGQRPSQEGPKESGNGEDGS